MNGEGLLKLAAELELAGDLAQFKAKQVVDRGLLNMKKDMADRWRGHRPIRGLPPSVSYDSEMTPNGARGEVGPVVGRRQGSLAGLIEGGELEYGNLRNAPIPAAKPAAEAERPRFEQALQDLAGDVL